MTPRLRANIALATPPAARSNGDDRPSPKTGDRTGDAGKVGEGACQSKRAHSHSVWKHVFVRMCVHTRARAKARLRVCLYV